MRRKDKEIADINDKMAIVAKCKVCRLGLSENNYPYVIPLNYGYTCEDEILTFYFHSAKEGRKMEIIRSNNNVCIEIDCDTQLIEGMKPCNYGYAFKSIVGFGKISFLETNDEKTFGLNCLTKHQTENDTTHDYTENELNNVCVYKMTVETFTGKQKLISSAGVDL
jgi:nitroimidazol reductase NimA-like FMN-containing flavoprotein (pyridoxamine 5'-phosphate oxidase superfamily)